LQTLLGLFCCL